MVRKRNSRSKKQEEAGKASRGEEQPVSPSSATVPVSAPDSTDRKPVEEALRRREERHRFLVESVNDWIWEVDRNGVYTYAGPQCREMFGYEPEEIVGKTPYDLMPPEEAKRVREVFDSIVSQARPFRQLENVIRRKDGSLVVLETNGVPVFDAQGNLAGYRGIDRDITERKQAEEALRERMKELACLYAIRRDMQEEVSVDELCRRVVAHLVPAMQFPESAVAVIELDGKRFTSANYREGLSHGLHAQIKAGAEVPGSVSVYYTQDQAFLIPEEQNLVDGVAEALSTWLVRKRAEEALRAGEERLRLALGAARMGAWEWKVGTQHAVWSPELYGLLGYERGEVTPSHEAFRRRIHPEDVAHWERTIRRSMELCEAYSCEFRVVWADGSAHWVEARGEYSYPRDESGAATVWMRGVLVDIEPRKQAEEALRESEERYRTLFESSRDGIIFTDMEGRILRANPCYQEMLGYSEEELRALTYQQLTPQRWQEREAAIVRDKIMSRGYSGEYEKEYIRKDGTVFPISIQVWLARDGQGEPQGMWGIVRDITERKQTEETLRESEARFRVLTTNLSSGVALIDEDGKFALHNPAFLTMFGLAPDSSIRNVNDQNWADWQVFEEDGTLLDVDDHPVRKAARTGRAVRNKLVGVRLPSGGDLRWMLVSAEPITGADGRRAIICTYHDITEQKRAEEALRQQAQLLQLSYDAIIVWRKDGGIEHWNRGAEQLYGYTENEVLGRVTHKLLKTIHPVPWREIEAAIRKHGQWEGELRHFAKDGHEVTVSARHQLVIGTDGIERILETNRDITDRNQAEEALRESEERYRDIVETATEGITMADANARTIFVNDRWCEMFGYSPEEAGQTTLFDVVFPEDMARMKERWEARKRGHRERYELRLRRKDGSPLWGLVSVAPRFDPDGRFLGTLVVMTDITEQKQAEKALRELNATLESKVAQRTAELRRRARQLQRMTLEMSEAEDRERERVAHILHDDLQQVLASAKFHLSMMRHEVRENPPLGELGDQINEMLKNAIEEARSLSHELRPAVLGQDDFAEILRWLANEMQTRHGLVVHVHGLACCQSDGVRVLLYRTAQELLFNTVKHAQVGQARVLVRQYRGCICLAVSDRGRGFDPAKLGETAGFGLLSIRQRVELIGGRMKIRSAPGRGSTFYVVVPDREVEPRVSGPAPGEETRRLRVLLADDHEIVRNGLASLLSEEPDVEVVGGASNGVEAVDLAERLHPDVVVMDVKMPTMSGDKAARQIRQRLPDTRVVALSMSEDPRAKERMHAAGAAAYVLKTAPPQELLAAIRGK